MDGGSTQTDKTVSHTGGFELASLLTASYVITSLKYIKQWWL